MVVAGVGKGGVRCSYVGDILCSGGAGGTSLWVRDMGYVPTNREDAGQIPPSDGPHTDGTAAN